MIRDYTKIAYTIYKTTNLINGKIYIGQTLKDLSISKYMGSGHAIEHAFLKYGKENFKREILEKVIGVENADKLEIFWISFFNSTDKTIGYNLSHGGNGYHGSPMKDEAISNIKLAAKNRNNNFECGQRLGKSNKNRIRSQEFKDKISSSTLGVKKTGETKDKMGKRQLGSGNHASKNLFVYDLELNLISQHSYAKEFAIIHNIPNHIPKALANCNRKMKSGKLEVHKKFPTYIFSYIKLHKNL